jgi:hypothetical protein
MPADPVRSRIMRSRASSYCHRATRKNVHGRVLLPPSVSRQSAPHTNARMHLPARPPPTGLPPSLPVPSHTTPAQQHALALAPRKSRRQVPRAFTARRREPEGAPASTRHSARRYPSAHRTHAHPNHRASLPNFLQHVPFFARMTALQATHRNGGHRHLK